MTTAWFDKDDDERGRTSDREVQASLRGRAKTVREAVNGG